MAQGSDDLQADKPPGGEPDLGFAKPPSPPPPLCTEPSATAPLPNRREGAKRQTSMMAKETRLGKPRPRPRQRQVLPQEHHEPETEPKTYKIYDSDEPLETSRAHPTGW